MHTTKWSYYAVETGSSSLGCIPQGLCLKKKEKRKKSEVSITWLTAAAAANATGERRSDPRCGRSNKLIFFLMQ